LSVARDNPAPQKTNNLHAKHFLSRHPVFAHFEHANSYASTPGFLSHLNRPALGDRKSLGRFGRDFAGLFLPVAACPILQRAVE
jgi:hypothetical protein